MEVLLDDTIAAISSPPGAAWRGIVRLSGPAAWTIACGLVRLAEEREVRRAMPCRLVSPPLPAFLLLFRGPASYTGLESAELHVPGTPALLNMVLRHALEAGARQALPGEFTAQAFFNGKLDLTEAEGVAATIAAADARQLAAAGHLRSGALHAWTEQTADELAQLLALVEAGIDFSDEPGVSFISAEKLRTSIAGLRARIAELCRGSERWQRRDAPPTVVLTGRANVGKSSLVNALAGSARALVSPMAGTTRDVLGVTLSTALGPVRVLDVAGVEEADTELAGQMNQARRRAVSEADVVVLVGDNIDTPATIQRQQAEIAELRTRSTAEIVRVCNKIDRAEAAGNNWEAELGVSAKTGEGLESLRALLVERLRTAAPAGQEHITLNQRHRSHLSDTAAALADAAVQAEQASALESPELLAADLRRGLDALGGISGQVSPDAVLGRIFGTFCVGK